MRSMTLLTTAALVAAALALTALVPSTQAIPPVCVGPELHEQVGPARVDSHGVNCTSVSVGTGPCPESIRTAPFMTIHTSSDCHIRVDIKFYDCVWNCGYESLVDTPVLTVRHYTEQDGETSSDDDVGVPADPCPITSFPPEPARGLLHLEQDKNPCLDTRVTVGRDVACTEPLSGSTEVRADRVAVLVPGCGPPGEPRGPDACTLEDATPQPARGGLWGTDEGCDIDVEPFGACVGGGGGYVEREMEPIHLKLLVCGPNLPPTP